MKQKQRYLVLVSFPPEGCQVHTDMYSSLFLFRLIDHACKKEGKDGIEHVYQTKEKEQGNRDPPFPTLFQPDLSGTTFKVWKTHESLLL